jgi:hypothetical protein
MAWVVALAAAAALAALFVRPSSRRADIKLAASSSVTAATMGAPGGSACAPHEDLSAEAERVVPLVAAEMKLNEAEKALVMEVMRARAASLIPMRAPLAEKGDPAVESAMERTRAVDKETRARLAKALGSPTRGHEFYMAYFATLRRGEGLPPVPAVEPQR